MIVGWSSALLSPMNVSMTVRVVYCKLCGYAERAQALADELRGRFEADVDVVEGKFGQFDVLIDDQIVASRGESFLARMMPRDAPDAAAVVAAIERHLAPREGESCVLPTTGSKRG